MTGLHTVFLQLSTPGLVLEGLLSSSGAQQVSPATQHNKHSISFFYTWCPEYVSCLSFVIKNTYPCLLYTASNNHEFLVCFILHLSQHNCV